MKFIGCIIATVIIWLVIFLITVSNGQVFTQALIHLACLIVICIIWAIFLIKRRKIKSGLSITAAILCFLHFALLCFVTVNLKSSYEIQKKFNQTTMENRRPVDEGGLK